MIYWQISFIDKYGPKHLISLLKNLYYMFCRRYLIVLKNNSQNVSTQKDDFKIRLCLQTQYVSQMNPEEFLYNTAISISSTTIHCRSLPLSLIYLTVKIQLLQHSDFNPISDKYWTSSQSKLNETRFEFWRNKGICYWLTIILIHDNFLILHLILLEALSHSKRNIKMWSAL